MGILNGVKTMGHTLSLQPYHPTRRYILKKNKMCLQKDFTQIICSSFIRAPNWKREMSTNGRMDKQTAVYSCNGTLLSENKRMKCWYTKWDESLKHYAEQQTDTTVHAISVQINEFQEQVELIYTDRNQNSGCLGYEGEGPRENSE